MTTQNILSFLVFGINQLAEILELLIFIAVILSWFQVRPNNPLTRFVYGLTYPIFSLIHRTLPFSRVGLLDLSPIIALILIELIRAGCNYLLALWM